MQNIFFKGLIVFGLLSQTQIAQSGNEHSHITELIEKYKLEPLVDSPYFKKNPDKLPYEKCKIYIRKRGYQDGGVGVVDTNYFNNSSLPTLFCYSTKLQTAFKMPLKIDYDQSIGLILGVADTAKKIRLRALDKKSLVDVLGYYHGIEAGITLGISFGGSALLNHERVALSFRDLGFGAKIALGGRVMNLAARTPKEEEIFALGFNAQSPSIKTLKDGSCHKEAYDRFWVHMTQGTNDCPPQDFTDLSYYQDFKFKHIKNINIKFWTKDFWKKAGDGVKEALNPDF